MSGGTHGSISEYCYAVRHTELRAAVDRVLDSNRSVFRSDDTTSNVLIFLRDGQSDTVVSTHPNSRSYFDIKIIHQTAAFDYRVQYVGSEISWDTSKTACLSVAYAFDEAQRGGSAGDGGVNWSRPLMKRKLLAVFENEFIHRIDSALGVTPIAEK